MSVIESDSTSMKAVVLFRFFFFQAEDGIRDGHVTGVQTCALPIFELSLKNNGAIVCVDTLEEATDLVNELAPEHLRSEERRVGKECRTQWRLWQLRKKSDT